MPLAVAAAPTAVACVPSAIACEPNAVAAMLLAKALLPTATASSTLAHDQLPTDTVLDAAAVMARFNGLTTLPKRSVQTVLPEASILVT